MALVKGNYRPTAQWESGGTTAFAPNNSVGGWQATFMSDALGNNNKTGNHTAQAQHSQRFQIGLGQIMPHQQALYDAMVYGEGRFLSGWKGPTAPKPLKTRSLTKAERDELESSLPF